jgi:hypothetical protein
MGHSNFDQIKNGLQNGFYFTNPGNSSIIESPAYVKSPIMHNVKESNQKENNRGNFSVDLNSIVNFKTINESLLKGVDSNKNNRTRRNGLANQKQHTLGNPNQFAINENSGKLNDIQVIEDLKSAIASK